MFLSLADDEKTHIAIIEAHIAKEGIGALIDRAEQESVGKKIKTIFSEATEAAQVEAGATTEDVEAVRMAMDFERKGYEYYKEAAGEATDEIEKGMFEFLTGIENEHYAVLQRTLQYLTDTKHWFLWEEGGPIEG
jgi:rubrerythrin